MRFRLFLFFVMPSLGSALSGCWGPTENEQGEASALGWSLKEFLHGSRDYCERGTECVSGICLGSRCSGYLATDDEGLQWVALEKYRSLRAQGFIAEKEVEDELSRLVALDSLEPEVQCRSLRGLTLLGTVPPRPALRRAEGSVCGQFYQEVLGRSSGGSESDTFLYSESETVRARLIRHAPLGKGALVVEALKRIGCQGEGKGEGVHEVAREKLEASGVGAPCGKAQD